MNATAVAAATGTQTDSELVALVRAGSDPAFAELYRRYRPRVGAFVRRMVRDDGRAEDLTQDAFVAALRRMRETDSEINFRPWIYEIARNASIDLHRRAGRTQELSFDSDQGLPASDLIRCGAAPGPDAIVIGRERFEHFRGALDELCDRHHQIIVLRELEGLSYREIGERMGLSDAAVESTLFRARKNLAHEYSQIGTGRRCASIGIAMERVSAGTADEGDRAKVARHARRCGSCRRRALALGVEPAPRRAAQVAALVPAFGLARRRAEGSAALGDAHQTLGMAGTLFGPGAPAFVAKAVSVIAAGALVAGGGATLGGLGPLARHHDAHPAGGATGTPAQRPAQSAPRSGSANPGPQAGPRRVGPGGGSAAPQGGSKPPAAGGPGLGVPKLPAAELPGVAVPAVKVPEVTAPELKIPTASMPRIHVPPIVPDVPAVEGPSLPNGPAAQANELSESVKSLLP